MLADRGFGDQALYELLKEQLGLDFVVRFRGIVKAARRDRLLLISAIAIALLTLLGASGEAIGIDRYLKANTSKGGRSRS